MIAGPGSTASSAGWGGGGARGFWPKDGEGNEVSVFKVPLPRRGCSLVPTEPSHRVGQSVGQGRGPVMLQHHNTKFKRTPFYQCIYI